MSIPWWIVTICSHWQGHYLTEQHVQSFQTKRGTVVFIGYAAGNFIGDVQYCLDVSRISMTGPWMCTSSFQDEAVSYSACISAHVSSHRERWGACPRRSRRTGLAYIEVRYTYAGEQRFHGHGPIVNPFQAIVLRRVRMLYTSMYT